jgi:hypothetical protein
LNCLNGPVAASIGITTGYRQSLTTSHPYDGYVRMQAIGPILMHIVNEHTTTTVDIDRVGKERSTGS